MTSEIHAHEALHLIGDHPEGVEAGELPNLLRETFGPKALFFACTAWGMEPEILIEFLLGRDKITLFGGKYRLNLDNICRH